jgi:hypothetical protein
VRIWRTTFVACALLVSTTAQIPPLPSGAETHWEIDGVNEIGVHILFDPATVADRLPPNLRFQTLQEIAPKAPFAQKYLAAHPEQAGYGISVLEVVRQRFSIDGREPQWPRDGAVGLWFAKVISTSPVNERARGSENLFLFALVPDRDYVGYMRRKGHYSTYGDVRLKRDQSGMWHGTIESADLQVEGACRPSTEASQKGRTGSETFYAPRGEGDHFLVLAWSDHEDHECNGRWEISGSHPLSKAFTIGSSIYACCYRLQGGAYSIDATR